MASRLILAFLLGLAGLVLFAPLPLDVGQPTEHHLTLEAHSFAFQPAVIQVNQGDRIILELESVDVTHGVYIDGYGVEAVSEPGHKARLDFVADRVGKFKYRCSLACGPLHPFMIGELIVRPNIPYWRAIGLTVIAAIGSIAYLWVGKLGDGRSDFAPAGLSDPAGANRDLAKFPTYPRIELTRISFIKRLLKWRGFQPTLMLFTLFFFMLAIMTALFGTPVGSKNFAIIFVWIVWWALLILILLPFTGRLWCLVCPLPAPGEWLQRRAIITKRRSEPFSLGKRWPRWLHNIWLQNFAFLGVAIFSAIILTRPWATGVVLLVFVLLGVGLSLIYERRAFCRYLCPVGGFIGLYSLLSPLELRVKDRLVCRQHRGRECYLGDEENYGCPWMVFPGDLERNIYCGLCTECLKSCPKDNIRLSLRPFGTDLLVAEGRGLDEAYKALIMLGSGLLYSAVLLGPWEQFKNGANMASLSGFALYAVAFLAVNLVALPGLFLLFTALAKGMARLREVPLKQLFIDCSYALVPLGLMGWVAFTFSFVFVNGSYAISVISDPFGWGWNLFGTRDYPWTPYLPEVVPYLQVAALVVGLIFSIYIAHRIGRQHSRDEGQTMRSLVPIAGFLTAVTIVFLRLYLG